MRAVAGLLILASLTITAEAAANGRFPEAQQIATVPGDPTTVFLRTTFGLLISKDAGSHWRWICERSLGYEGQWDPTIATTKDGRVWIGLEDGIVSTKDGCTVDRAEEMAGETVKDLTTDAKAETVYAITGQPGKRGFIWRRTPSSGKFEKLAGMDDVNFMTIEVAPSSSQRVYVSGQPYRTIRGQIYRSDDGGKSFTTDIGDGGAASSGLKNDGPFFIGAIDRQDPNRMLVRHLHAKASDLLLTKDGGKTFTNVLSMRSSMFGFAKTDDGKTYWAGSGLEEDGIFRSTDRGEHFEKIAKHGVLCLYSTPGTLFLCENAFTLGAYSVATSKDDGTTITPIAKFEDVLGPVECDVPDARASMCAGVWPDQKNRLLAPVDAGPKPEPEQEPAPAPKKSSCGCEAVGASSLHGERVDRGWLISLALIAIYSRRRRLPRVAQTSRVDRSPSIPRDHP